MRNPTVTEAMAQQGIAPPPMTRAQWDAMHAVSAQETRDKHYRMIEDYIVHTWRNDD